MHTIWFLTTKHLGFRGKDEARQLKLGDFEIIYDGEGEIKWIEWNERENKTRPKT